LHVVRLLDFGLEFAGQLVQPFHIFLDVLLIFLEDELRVRPERAGLIILCIRIMRRPHNGRLRQQRTGKDSERHARGKNRCHKLASRFLHFNVPLACARFSSDTDNPSSSPFQCYTPPLI